MIDLLDVHGLPAHTEVMGAAWRSSVPPPMVILAVVVAAAGVATGFAAATPFLLVASPIVAAGLVAAAAFGRRTPMWNPPPAGASTLGKDAAREAARALAGLPRGQARRLLVDVLRRAASVTDASSEITAIVVAACGAARDLAALEEHLDAFDAGSARLADHGSGWLDALSRCEQGRDLLTQRLLETSASLSRWQAATRVTDAGRDLGQLARALDEESRIQGEAAREIADLLK